MNTLFSSEPLKLDLQDAEIYYYPTFFDSDMADSLFKILLERSQWQQDKITLFNKEYTQPRLTALYGNEGKSYSYSSIIMHPIPWTIELQKIKKVIEAELKVTFTTVLLNLYRDGKDSNGWHADDEKELGQNPIIASLSLGAERTFQLRHNVDKSLRKNLVLEHGSLLVMKGTTQHFWKHQIPKTNKFVGERINLTFRSIQ